jgi:hypothetical protein
VADHVCGNTDGYYLIPIEVIHRIQEDPRLYKSSYHPTHRVISVNTRTHEASFSRSFIGGIGAGHETRRIIGKREIDIYRNGLMFEKDHVVGVSKR